ncbi:BTB/POZ protein [Ochromonadaceae sp. CCMP2298]|nr:BTB/POZ protein [Ochromonadaceae sp. CCMP2298]
MSKRKAGAGRVKEDCDAVIEEMQQFEAEKQQWEAEKQQLEAEKQQFKAEKQQWEAAKEAIIQEAKKEADIILMGAAGAAEEKQQWEAEKAALAGVQHFESVLNLNVGGVRYTTSLTTLRRFPDSMIGCMFSGRHALSKGEDGYFFIDRDGTHFRHILNFLRSPEGNKVVGVADAEKEELRRECDYYGIDQLMFAMPCTEKELTCRVESKLTDPKFTLRYSILPILVDSQGVYTVRGVKPSTQYPNDGKIEYCPHCYWGFCYKGDIIYWAEKFNDKCEGGMSAAQPRVQGKCRNCRESS